MPTDPAPPPPPLPVLTGEPAAPRAVNPEPPVVRDARGAAILILVVCVLGALVMMGNAVLGDPNPSAPKGISAEAVALIYAGFGALYVWLFVGLKRRNPAAWRVQIAPAVLGLLAFPLGTILHASILTRWFKPGTRAWFGRT